jgi:hypothetical protein
MIFQICKFVFSFLWNLCETNSQYELSKITYFIVSAEIWWQTLCLLRSVTVYVKLIFFSNFLREKQYISLFRIDDNNLKSNRTHEQKQLIELQVEYLKNIQNATKTWYLVLLSKNPIVIVKWYYWINVCRLKDKLSNICLLY